MNADVPKELDAIVDLVLAHKAKPKSKPGKKRKRRAAKFAKATFANNARDAKS